MIGKRFGRLEVIERIGTDKYGKCIYNCLCDCGEYTRAVSSKLNAGRKLSCGCLMEENKKLLKGGGNTKHGDSNSPEFNCWSNIKDRCFNPNHPSYPHYGGRGITMADEWVNDYGKFLEHVGRRPSDSHSIERIDNEKGYYPGNLRWALLDDQSINKRWTRWVEYNGEQVKLMELCWENGWNPDVIRGRLNQGWSLEDAINEPLNRNHKRITIDGVTKNLSQWLEEYDIKHGTYWYRKKQGMTDIDAITTPKHKGQSLAVTHALGR